MACHDLPTSAKEALHRAADFSFENAIDDSGHWCGELKSNVAITSEYIFLRQAFNLSMDADGDAFRDYLLSEQNSDGSWSLAPGLPGDVSASTEAYLALKILGLSTTSSPAMQRACARIRELGGVAKVRVFTRIFLATFGLFPWTAVPQLPVELVLLPASSPINIYKFASWARSTIMPLLIICHHRPVYALPNGTSATNGFLDELWLDPSQKVVPYAPTFLSLLRQGNVYEILFTIADTLLATLGGLRWVPFLRSHARRRCMQWILERQEASGDWAGIFPPMYGGIYALVLEGFSTSDDPVRLGLEALERFTWQDAAGKRMQPCVSPVWDTALMTIELCDSVLPDQSTTMMKRLSSAVQWLKSQQKLGPEGDWRVYRPFLAPGGFSFELFNSWYPDVDDTAAVVLAFLKQGAYETSWQTVAAALQWILGMQNADGGWAAFDVHNNSLFLNHIPFSDMDSLCDPSTADVTGRVLEAFGLTLRRLNDKHEAQGLISRIQSASLRAVSFLARVQEPDGSWYGRWGSNYIYGTSNVVCGLIYFADTNDLVPGLLPHAMEWLKSVQNSDGGWGETLHSYSDPKLSAKGPSTPSQTAWAIMALLTKCPRDDSPVLKGVQWLVSAQTDTINDKNAASWPEKPYTGVGFPNHFYIGYTLYRHYFPMMALGRFVA